MTRKFIFPCFIILMLVFLLMGCTLFPGAQQMIIGQDTLTLQWYIYSHFVESIKSGTIPFWDPYTFSGTPFLANPLLTPFYPFILLFFLFPIKQAFSIVIALHLFLAGIFMYRYMRRQVD